MPRDDDDRPDNYPRFPMGIRLAGIIWIVFGTLGLIGTMVNLATMGMQGPNANPGSSCGVGCGVLFAIAFLVVGVQTVRGTARDTLGNGIGSIAFSLLYLGIATFLLFAGVAGANQGRGGGPAAVMTIVAAFSGGLGLMLLTAGVLALGGRTAYKEWRRAEGRDRPRRRDEDYEDDRYRRRRDVDDGGYEDDHPRRRDED